MEATQDSKALPTINKEEIQENRKLIDGILLWINGNGKPGAKTVLYDIEHRMVRIENLQWSILGAVVIAVILSVVKLFAG